MSVLRVSNPHERRWTVWDRPAQALGSSDAPASLADLALRRRKAGPYPVDQDRWGGGAAALPPRRHRALGQRRQGPMDPRPLSATDRYRPASSAGPRAGSTGSVAALAAVVLAHRASDRGLGRLRTLRLHVTLQVPVVALSRANVTMPELVLHVLQGVPARHPRRRRGMPQRVQRHIAQVRVLQRRLMPIARDGRAVEWLAIAVALPAPLVGLADPHWHGVEQRIQLVAAGHRRALLDLLAHDRRQARTDLHRAETIRLR